MYVYNNGTNVVDAITHLTSLTLGTALPIASGGTGTNTTTFCNLQSNVTGVLPNANTTAASANGASTIVARDASGNFTAATITATTFSGSGSSLTSIPNSATTAASANGASTIVARDASGNFTANVITANGSALTSLNAENISSGTLAVSRGGTGATTLNAAAVIIGNGTSAVNFVAPGTSGNALVSNGSTWVSGAPSIKGLGFGGETWQDATGTFSINTNYTNNYGYPIAMSASWATGNGQFIVNGVGTALSTGANQNTDNGIFIIIPTGATWQLARSSVGVAVWAMLV
jgi:hypothetical protein